MKINWLWDARLSKARIKRILKNENDPRFYIYAEKLFSRVNNPKIVFGYVPKEVFYNKWPVIKQRIEKDKWAKQKVDFWQTKYEEMTSIPAERMSIAQQIKNIRIKLGYTQIEMAKKLGVIQQFVSKLEAGRENVTVDTLKHIANVFDKKLTIQLN